MEVEAQLDQLDRRQKRGGLRVGRRAQDELIDLAIRDLVPELLNEPRLADPGLAHTVTKRAVPERATAQCSASAAPSSMRPT